MKLGVVIVTYNRLELLKECVAACLKQTYEFERVIIINNASTDGTYEYLSKIKNDKVKIVNSEINLGGSGGFYVGIENAISLDLDYVLVIDDDAILDKEYNNEIVRYIEEDNNNVCAYSGTVKTNDEIQLEHRRHLYKEFKCKDSTIEEYKTDYFDYELSTFCGLYIPTKIIKEIGLPKKEFFIWFDDTEYSLRLRKYGKIRNVNSTFLNHKTSIIKNSGYNWKSYYGLRNQIVIIREYFSKRTLLKYAIKMLIMIVGGKVMRIIKNDKYYSVVSNIYIDALKDGMKNNLGKNEKYIPNFKIQKSNNNK